MVRGTKFGIKAPEVINFVSLLRGVYFREGFDAKNTVRGKLRVKESQFFNSIIIEKLRLPYFYKKYSSLLTLSLLNLAQLKVSLLVCLAQAY